MTRPRFETAALQFVLFFATVFLVLCGFAAHAQDVLIPPSAAGSPAGPAWVTALVQYVVVPLIPVLGTLAAWVLTKLAGFLHAKQDNSKAAGAFAIAVDFFEKGFSHLRSGLETDLKMALADGTLDATERAQLVAKLVTLVKAELPSGVQQILGGVLGPALETWLSGKAGQVIQAAVAEAPTGVAAVTQVGALIASAKPLAVATSPQPA